MRCIGRARTPIGLIAEVSLPVLQAPSLYLGLLNAGRNHKQSQERGRRDEEKEVRALQRYLLNRNPHGRAKTPPCVAGRGGSAKASAFRLHATQRGGLAVGHRLETHNTSNTACFGWFRFKSDEGTGPQAGFTEERR